ncbi:MAG: discoidin domain-containing protein, partial [Cyanobium sp.]
MVSSDAETWYEVECGRIFDPGYQYYHSLPRPEWFDNPVMTRYVRIYPLEWYGMPGGRFSIMLC